MREGIKVWAWILAMALTATASALPGPGGSDVGTGGDAVKCTAKPGEPLYALDYLLTSSGDDRDLVKIQSWEQSRDRLSKLLGAKYPKLAHSFASFVEGLENRTPHVDYLKPRIWEGSPNELVYLDDQQIVRKLSESCVRLQAGGKLPIVQVVIREKKPNRNAIYYEYDEASYEWMRAEAPLQFSFLLVHEWLRDFTSDVAVVRRATRFLHSDQLETLDAQSLQDALDHIGIAKRQTEFKPICERTAAIRRALEEAVRLPCRLIRESDLEIITGLDLTHKGIEELESGDFTGLWKLDEVHIDHNDLRFLPDDIFAGLFNLRKVVLSDNRLEQIPASLFADAPNLRSLNLSRNPVRALPEGLLAPVRQPDPTERFSLFLIGLPLTELPEDLFARGRHYDVLDLRRVPLPPTYVPRLRGLSRDLVWELRLVDSDVKDPLKE